MFLIRSAFWLSLIVLLLPTDPVQQARFFATAEKGVVHVATFCERNGATCVKAGELWEGFKEKAEFGGRIALSLAQSYWRGRDEPRQTATREPEPRREPAPDAAPRRSPGQERDSGREPIAVARGTLTDKDRTPAWRSGQHRQ